MSIIQVEKKNKQLQNISTIVASAKKAIVVTGAGISTNCGIPVSLIVFDSGMHLLKMLIPHFRTFGHKLVFII